MTLILPRRRFIAGALGLLATPAIVRASSLMPVRPVDQSPYVIGVDMGASDPLTIIRVWQGNRVVWEAPIKSLDLQLARAS